MCGSEVVIRPILKIPREIWAEIFRYCVDAELKDYTRKLRFLPFRSVPMVLSAVCQFWRDVVHSEPGLWNTVNVTPSECVSNGAQEILCKHLQRNKGTITFVSSLCQTVPYAGNSESCYSDHHFSCLRCSRVIKTQGDNYVVHLIIKNDSFIYVEKAQNLPFREPKLLKIDIKSEGVLIGRAGIYSAFSTVQNLDLTYLGAHLNQLRALATSFPSLRILSLQLHDIGDFDLTSLLSVRLEEIYIRDNGNNDAGRLDKPLQLPNLRVLGVTHPARMLLESIRAPHIEELQLYGSIYPLAFFGYDQTARSLFQKVQRIVMKDWDRSCGSILAANNYLSRIPQDAGTVFVRRARDFSSLRSASFSNCYLDGSVLVELFKRRLEETDSVFSHFDTLAFSSCSGITRTECEVLANLVPRLKIYD
jgi:hypothetical protein